MTSVWKRDAELAQRALGARQELRRAAAAGGRVAQQGDVAIHRADYAKTSVSSRSAIATGLGSRAASAASRSEAPVSTIAPSMPALCAAPRSASTRSPTMSARPGPSRSSAVCTSVGSGLPIVSTVRPEAYSTAAMIGARAGPQAVGVGERRVAVGADQEGAAQRGLRRLAQLVVVELRVERDDDDVGAAGERRAVDDPQAGRLDVAVQRGRADDERRAAGEALGEDELQRAADRDDLLQRGLEAQAPELRTYSSVPSCESLVTNATPLPAARRAATASTAPGVGSSPSQTQPSRSSRMWS